MDISPAQCRAARALLNLTQNDLAEASRVSKRTITHFEAEQRTPVPATLAAIQRALENAGVSFTERGVEQKTDLANPEWTAEDFRKALPASKLPEAVQKALHKSKKS